MEIPVDVTHAPPLPCSHQMQTKFLVRACGTVWLPLALQPFIIAPWAPGKGALKFLPSVGSLHHKASLPSGPWSKNLSTPHSLLTPQVSAQMSPPHGSLPRFPRLSQVPHNSLCKNAEPLLHSTYHYCHYMYTSLVPSKL